MGPQIIIHFFFEVIEAWSQCPWVQLNKLRSQARRPMTLECLIVWFLRCQ